MMLVSGNGSKEPKRYDRAFLRMNMIRQSVAVLLALFIASVVEAQPRPKLGCVGDSVVEGTHVENSWCRQLGGINFGVSGNTILHVLKRIDSIIAAKPRRVIIAVGLNDAYRVDGQPQVSIEDFRTHYEIVIKTFRRHRIEVILQTPNCNILSKEFNRWLRPYVLEVRELAKKFDLKLIDAYPRFAESIVEGEVRFVDDIHLDQSGHDLVADLARVVLRRRVK